MFKKFAQAMDDAIAERIGGVHTCTPGKIESYDPSSNMAKVKPFGDITTNKGQKVAYPEIHEVPLWFMQSNDQKTTIVTPVKAGDYCLLLYGEQQLDTFLNDGGESATDLKHDLTNAIAIYGLFNKPNKNIIEACEEEKIIIANDSIRIIVKTDIVEIEGDVHVKGNVEVDGDVVASGISLVNHVHENTQPGPGQSGKPI